ncbi:MAG: prepilin-type N-terminal cleavage/methylation domain-containing protein [candidate division NC10 bacterium]|nr:prepilin-type N-terminal cleavage/methylation domain-containing protein [candidate division NC10 bacterium]
MTKALRSQKGFTLIELVIIIVLLGLLAAVAIPRYIDLREDARKAAAKGNLDAARAALTLDFASAVVKQQSYSLTITTGNITSVIEARLESPPKYPSGFSWVTVSNGSSTSPARVSATLDGVDVTTL